MKELNPNHLVTRTAHDHWHKIVAVLLHKFGDILPNEVAITSRDLQAMTDAFPEGMPVVVLEDRDGALRVRLVSEQEGARLARKAGGLPT